MKRTVLFLSTLLVTGVAQAGKSEQTIHSGNESYSGAYNHDLVNISESHTSKVQGAKYRVNSAIAVPLVTGGNEVCMGSSSAAGQGPSFGISIGSTWTDEDCVRRKDAMMLTNLGDKQAARALMCQKPEIADAYLAAGIDCPVSKTQVKNRKVKSQEQARRERKGFRGNRYSMTDDFMNRN